MSASSSQDEEPLSPEEERARQLVKRFMLISFSTFGLGILVLVIAIFYKVFLDSDQSIAQVEQNIVLNLSNGEEILSLSAAEGRLYVVVGAAGDSQDVQNRVIILDEKTGNVIKTISP